MDVLYGELNLYLCAVNILKCEDNLNIFNGDNTINPLVKDAVSKLEPSEALELMNYERNNPQLSASENKIICELKHAFESIMYIPPELRSTIVISRSYIHIDFDSQYVSDIISAFDKAAIIVDNNDTKDFIRFIKTEYFVNLEKMKLMMMNIISIYPNTKYLEIVFDDIEREDGTSIKGKFIYTK